MPENSSSVPVAAAEALRRGYQPLPIKDGTKRPLHGAWTHERHDYGGDRGEIIEAFTRFGELGAGSIGLLLGEPSGGLIDVDIDHPKSSRLKDHFLPSTGMMSGRPGRPRSHYWYLADGTIPGTRRYQMPDRAVSVELRSTGGQTLIPPSIHPSGEPYRWEGPKRSWGEPARVPGKTLAVQVALLALGSVLIDRWPKQGVRHDAYLALAGGLLRYGDDVHPWWERNISVLIRALAVATGDEDGPDAREGETVRTTIARLRGLGPSGAGKVTGFPKLGEIIGQGHAETARRLAFEVESLSGFQRQTATVAAAAPQDGPIAAEADEPDPNAVPAARNPYDERKTSWSPFDLDPFISGEYKVELPSILRREDGRGLFYHGKVNSLFGRSESAKSWVALFACVQEMGIGNRVVYIDFEDGPETTIDRLHQLGVGDDDIRAGFTYIRPEDPHAAMQRNRWGDKKSDDVGVRSEIALDEALARIDPRLIIADGMTMLYGLHGLDTNDAGNTDVITSWLKKLTRQMTTTVIVIDHTGKGAPRGTTPIGSQHKVSMVQGTALQVYPIDPPRKGRLGTMELLVGKDRPGEVRAFAVGGEVQTAAMVEMDSRKAGQTSMRIMVPPDDEATLDFTDDSHNGATIVSETIASKLREYIPRVFGADTSLVMTGPQMGAAVTEKFGVEFGDQSRRDAVAALVKAGILRKIGATVDSEYSLAWP